MSVVRGHLVSGSQLDGGFARAVLAYVLTSADRQVGRTGYFERCCHVVQEEAEPATINDLRAYGPDRRDADGQYRPGDSPPIVSGEQ